MRKTVLIPFLLLGALCSCSEDFDTIKVPEESKQEILFSGTINQEYLTRANDSGFAAGDRMGVYIVDYNNGEAGTLNVQGNRANNLLLSLSDEGRWTSISPVYWKDASSAIDVYGYYPYTRSIDSIESYGFTVESDQSSSAGDGDLGGYEKSDFLWAIEKNVQPTKDPIILDYAHRMSGVKISLVQGDGFVGDEWNKVAKIVTIDNTIRKAFINISNGVVTPNGSIDKSIRTAPQGNDVYRAVIVPQHLTSGTNFIGITIDGISYHYVLEQDLDMRSGMMNNFLIKVSKKSIGDYVLSLEYSDIAAWENDKTSHLFETSAYVVVDCPEEGTLASCVESLGLNPAEILNLKVIGRMNDVDFYYIRDYMAVVQSLNLGDVVCVGNLWAGYGDSEMVSYSLQYSSYHDKGPVDNVLPRHALEDKQSLKHLILPKDVKVLGAYSLKGLSLAYNTTLVLPNSLFAIETDALSGLSNCNLVLSDNLELIGFNGMCNQTARYDFRLPNQLKYIGIQAFSNSSGLRGGISLPENLMYIGSSAFMDIQPENPNSFFFKISIPEGVTSLDVQTFMSYNKNECELYLPETLTEIGDRCFANNYINNYVEWPSSLQVLGDGAFDFCNFRGGCSDLPEGLIQIGTGAFRDSKLPEGFSLPNSITIVPAYCFAGANITNMHLPANLESIGNSAFQGCESLSSIRIGKYVESIGDAAFNGCWGLRSIVCLASDPPELGTMAFNNCDMEHLILEVPEGSINKYRNAKGWDTIKYITAHHELAVNSKSISCLGKGGIRDLIIHSEGGWELIDAPQWCHLSQTSSDIHTTEVRVTIDRSVENREGDIVFKLSGSDYSSACHVNQYISSENEDYEIILQSASSGYNPIPVFIVGDGFTAEQIADGTYFSLCRSQMDYLFSIEPFKSYRDYFTVSTAYAVSPEHGINTISRNVKNKFNTTDDPETGYRCDMSSLKDYVLNVSRVIDQTNISKALVMVLLNQDTFGGNVLIDDDGFTVSFNAISPKTYPMDTRGLVQYYAGGLGFGRLAPEAVSKMDFFKGSDEERTYRNGSLKGWYKNVSASATMNSVPWSHLIFNPKYSDIVDMYEGAYNNLRGIYRSEERSCMSDYSQYYNTISRELIVRRIMDLSGDSFSFDGFVNKDSREGIQE